MLRTGRPRSLFGDGCLLLFLIAQVCDGVFTYVGVRTFGPVAEGNPIVAWYIAAVGVGVALIAIKGVAIGCAALLHVQARHRTVGVLTVFYFAVAVLPWMDILMTVD